MPVVFRRHSNVGQTPDATGREPVIRLAGILVCGAAVVAGGYFALLYLLTTR